MSASTAGQPHAGPHGALSHTSDGSGGLPAQLLDSRYDSLEPLGVGAFGSVVRARHVETGTAVAVKLLSRGPYFAATASNKPYMLYVGREILHQASLCHPFIVQLFEAFLTPQHLAIVMEYADVGSLLAYQQAQPGRRLSEGTTRWLFQQLVIGLDYAHQRGVSNRDLKLENLMLCRNGGPEAQAAERPLLKIGDFGYSKHDYNSSARTRCGTEIYMAPEVVTCNGKYDAKKADVWSCGVILYTMVAGIFPWTPGGKDCLKNIVQAKYSFPEGLQVAAGLQDLLSRILQPDPDQRWSTGQIMAHPWFLQDLPPGAQHMNAYYMAHAPQVESLATQIGSILEAAAHTGAPGEPLLSVQFSRPAPSVPPA